MNICGAQLISAAKLGHESGSMCSSMLFLSSSPAVTDTDRRDICLKGEAALSTLKRSEKSSETRSADV